jgi:hypothetical protein
MYLKRNQYDLKFNIHTFDPEIHLKEEIKEWLESKKYTITRLDPSWFDPSVIEFDNPDHEMLFKLTWM